MNYCSLDVSAIKNTQNQQKYLKQQIRLKISTISAVQVYSVELHPQFNSSGSFLYISNIQLQNHLKECHQISFFYCNVTKLPAFFSYNFPSGHVDVQWTPIERPYWTCGRPKGTFNGRLVDVPNETQHVRPSRTKMDFHFRPSMDAMQVTQTPCGLPPDVHQMSTGRRLDVIFDWYGAWTSVQTSIRLHIR